MQEDGHAGAGHVEGREVPLCQGMQMHFTGIFCQELQPTSHQQKEMNDPWGRSYCLPACLVYITPIKHWAGLPEEGNQSWVSHGIPQKTKPTPQHPSTNVFWALPDKGCKSEPEGHCPEPLSSLKLGRHHKLCCDRKDRGCEINPDNLGQSRDSQVGSGGERESISGKRNSILRDEREGVGRENVKCTVFRVVHFC